MRKNLEEVKNTDSAITKNLVASSELKDLIESYIVNKEKEANFKKSASSENTQIKELMHQYGLSEYTTDLGTAKLTEQESVAFIEERLIEFLKVHKLDKDIVKTKEYVDYDALESAMYHETIPLAIQKEMSSCKEVKVTTVLRISKKGK